MARLLVATTNRGKLVEIRHEFAQAGLEAWELSGLGDFPELPECHEDRPTFAGNALKKARHYAELTGLLTLADDSGLCVDALAGAPGVQSARYAGSPCDNAANNRKLLEAMAKIPPAERGARFVCAMALATPRAELSVMVDEVRGEILTAPRGEKGFGYDPLFWIPELQMTTAEVPLEQKGRISHRGKALRRMIAWMDSPAGRAGVNHRVD